MANNVEWIKLSTNMFDNKKIKKLRRLPDGNNLVLIWVMLLTIAGKSNAGGMILISENIPYTAEDLADELDFEVNTVRLALESLERLGMIYREEENVVISNWYEYQSKDGLEKIREQTRLRTIEYRKRKKTECDVTVTSHVTQSSYSISNSNSYSDSIKEIIDYLNTKCNKRYSVNTKEYRKNITARLKEGYTVDDFKTVIDKKYNEWIGTEFEQYLKPTTLFAPSHFDEYLNQTTTRRGGNKAEQQLNQTASLLQEFVRSGTDE